MIGRIPGTPRLRMRILAPSDLSLFRELYCDSGTMRHVGRPLSSARATASLQATLDATRKPGLRFFVIIERRSKQAVGLCSIRPTKDIRCPEVGMMLVRTVRGLGYGNETLGALIDAAFRTLPITAVSVQYRPANVSAGRLCDGLGFAAQTQPQKSGPCVRILRRLQWHRRFHQPKTKGKAMPNIIGFLEQAGRNAALRHATREQLLRELRDQDFDQASQDALLQPQHAVLEHLIGVRDTMYCSNQAIAPPKKKAPAKKKPVKAPPKKKAPAKKPAKKAPAKRKR